MSSLFLFPLLLPFLLLVFEKNLVLVVPKLKLESAPFTLHGSVFLSTFSSLQTMSPWRFRMVAFYLRKNEKPQLYVLFLFLRLQTETHGELSVFASYNLHLFASRSLLSLSSSFSLSTKQKGDPLGV